MSALSAEDYYEGQRQRDEADEDARAEAAEDRRTEAIVDTRARISLSNSDIETLTDDLWCATENMNELDECIRMAARQNVTNEQIGAAFRALCDRVIEESVS